MDSERKKKRKAKAPLGSPAARAPSIAAVLKRDVTAERDRPISMPPLQLPPPLLAAPPPPPAASATPTPAPEGAVPVAPQGEDKPVCAAPVPEGPPEPTDALLPATAGVAVDENYSKDEQALNSFLRLHPMLSAEACSQRTLQAMAGMFEKAVVGAGQLPVVGKLHDDAMLRPPNDAIGERPCVNADRCLAQFIAQLRYGPGTPYAFTCTEYLLPDQQRDFLNGKGVPARRGKCLLCMRYFTHYTYCLARTDPNFKVGETSLGLQVFCNAVGPSDDAGGAAVHDDAQLRAAATELPTHASVVNAKDGYKPSAMLFVDEEFYNTRTARESRLGQLLFKPVVRFCSTHYRYEMEDGEPRILQVGIGADDQCSGLGFRAPASGGPSPASASSEGRR